MDDLEGNIPGSVMNKALAAQQQLKDYLTPKFIRAAEMTQNSEWTEECLIKGLFENDAFFDDGTYTVTDKVDQTIGLAFAAYDTSATSTSNLLYSMHKHPEETDVVRKAIMTHPQLSDKSTRLTMDMMKSCNELQCFVNESQRQFGIATVFIREVNDENGLQFGDYLIPDKTRLMVPIQWLHHGESSWTDPLEFRPSRFDKSQSKEERGDIGRYNHIPFATGLHKCLGIHLALLEMYMYTVLLLRDWEFEVDEEKMTQGQDVVGQMNLANGIPHFNVHLKLRRR